MSDEKALVPVHPEGELQKVENEPWETAVSLDTFAGKIQFKWAPDAEVSSLGQMPFFIEFLKTSGLFENWVKDCPLHYTSPNAPQKRDVLGTILLSVLAGHWRYAHISALRSDGVNPELLGMTRSCRVRRPPPLGTRRREIALAFRPRSEECAPAARLQSSFLAWSDPA